MGSIKGGKLHQNNATNNRGQDKITSEESLVIKMKRKVIVEEQNQCKK